MFIVTTSDTSDLYASYFQNNQQEEAVTEIHSALCGFFVLNSVLKNLQHSSTNETHHDFFYSEKYLQKTELRRGQRFLAALPFSI